MAPISGRTDMLACVYRPDSLMLSACVTEAILRRPWSYLSDLLCQALESYKLWAVHPLISVFVPSHTSSHPLNLRFPLCATGVEFETTTGAVGITLICLMKRFNAPIATVNSARRTRMTVFPRSAPSRAGSTASSRSNTHPSSTISAPCAFKPVPRINSHRLLESKSLYLSPSH